ncbi:MAG TPA: hypothetical protein VGP15_14460 [Burkholderiales bacterium]|nr:hypothetical protein [Burkholderiales bacterium]
MVLRVLDPIAEINKPAERKQMRGVESLHGKRVGLLWGRHAASMKFWPAFEEVVLKKFSGEPVRLYKNSSWNPAPIADVEALAGKIDYAFIGVGA